MFQSFYTTIVTNIQKYLWKGSGLSINSVNYHTISISKYNFLIGSSYIKLPKELAHSRKGLGLINTQNTNDNECYKWGIVWYLKPADGNQARITNTNKDFAKKKFLKT